jgi:hypothetical protein
MTDDRMTDGSLSSLERSLAAELKRTPVPASIEAAVMRHFDRTCARRRTITAIAVLGTVAALVIAAIVIPGRHQPPAAAPTPIAQAAPEPPLIHSPEPPPQVAAAPSIPIPEPPTAFVAIPYAQPLEAQDRATIVRMSLSLPALAAAGLPIIAAEPDTLAQADVLIGEDGAPRAIRLISLSTR